MGGTVCFFYWPPEPLLVSVFFLAVLGFTAQAAADYLYARRSPLIIPLRLASNIAFAALIAAYGARSYLQGEVGWALVSALLILFLALLFIRAFVRETWRTNRSQG